MDTESTLTVVLVSVLVLCNVVAVSGMLGMLLHIFLRKI